jgi:hypothetical protein
VGVGGNEVGLKGRLWRSRRHGGRLRRADERDAHRQDDERDEERGGDDERRGNARDPPLGRVDRLKLGHG